MTHVTQPDETNLKEFDSSIDISNNTLCTPCDRKLPEEFPNYLGNGTYAAVSGDVVGGDVNQCI